VSETLLQLGPRPPVMPKLPAEERTRLERQARLLAWGGNAWHLVEFAIAIAAGADSLIEGLSGLVIVWLFTGGRGSSQRAERRAQQLIGVSYVILAAYLGVESGRDLVVGHQPDASWVGIGLAAFTAPTMPLLALVKRRVGKKLSSPAMVSEAQQNQLCAYLSIALLVGLLANALAGWWWADPVAAAVIGAVALREGIETWRGDLCDCC
jgi:hypothetical protein